MKCWQDMTSDEPSLGEFQMLVVGTSLILFFPRGALMILFYIGSFCGYVFVTPSQMLMVTHPKR